MDLTGKPLLLEELPLLFRTKMGHAKDRMKAVSFRPVLVVLSIASGIEIVAGILEWVGWSILPYTYSDTFLFHGAIVPETPRLFIRRMRPNFLGSTFSMAIPRLSSGMLFFKPIRHFV